MAALSGDAACPDALFGVVPLCDVLGAGVAEERPAVAVAGVSGTADSDGAVGIVKDCLAWRAVVCIAFTSRLLFCFLFRELDETLGLWPVIVSDKAPSTCCRGSGWSSDGRFLLASVASFSVASLIGQTNPVLGVYAGRCAVSESNEL